jgi:cellulose synthase/poly-beta-1,6-N-acetylglucosamine synthase-like glycosyltransferase
MQAPAHRPGTEPPTAGPPHVAVIIPYYQREPGILTRAVDSVLAQVLPHEVLLTILVIDDNSPHPAETDLAALWAPPRITIKTVYQANAGPGAARNRGAGNRGTRRPYRCGGVPRFRRHLVAKPSCRCAGCPFQGL